MPQRLRTRPGPGRVQPLLGAYAALWLCYGSEPALRWLKWLALRNVDGRYHAFRDQPVGLRWGEGQCWVQATDAFAVLDEVPDETVLRRLRLRFGDTQFVRDAHGHWWFAERAIIDWLDPRAARQPAVAAPFARWLQREVFPPMHRRAGRG